VPASEFEVEVLVGLLQQGYMTMAELDYPYAVDFAGYSLPGNSSVESCKRFTASIATSAEGKNLAVSAVQRLAKSLTVVPQLDPARSTGGCINASGYSSFEETLPGLTPGAWSYQRCSDILIPYASSARGPLYLPCEEFPQNCWNVSRFSAWCEKTYGVRPSVTAGNTQYGGRDVRAAGKNIYGSLL